MVVRAAAEFRPVLTGTPEPTALDGNRRLCATLLEAAVAVSARRADARDLLLRADSIFIYSNVVLYSYYPVVAARLYEVLGADVEALRLLRRRAVALDGPEDVSLLSTTLRAEGRLASAAGDTAGAILAYRHFLALRADPEPALVPQRDSVRAALAALLKEPRPNHISPR